MASLDLDQQSALMVLGHLRESREQHLAESDANIAAAVQEALDNGIPKRRIAAALGHTNYANMKRWHPTPPTNPKFEED